jgi:protein-S-isoprenylcysteine O-methyltransferase Ste14
VTWGIAYVVCVAAFVVRVRADDAPPEPVWPQPGEPVWLTRLHHVLLVLVLVGTPLERALVPAADGGRAVGAVLFAVGVVLYRAAGRTLGAALSPFTEPRQAAPLVTRGLYRYLRHPMYLSQALIAVGAPLTLGSRYVIVLALPTVIVLIVRILREDEALARTFPEYARYAARTKRILPFVY